MANTFGRRIFALIAACGLATVLTGCSPFYVVRAAYEQGKILASREDIQDLLEDQNLPNEERSKLQLVLEARAFGMELGLEPGRAFTQYARVDGEAVAWVVSAAPKDKFELYQWWFPIVGSVPYKGFFEKPDAVEEARKLERDDYETWVRGTEAFSTLGWFDDPVLSTTLQHSIPHIANTVLHESLHTTVWIPNYVDFNESLANYIGFRASTDFFKRRLDRCNENHTAAETAEACQAREGENLASAERALKRELAISDGLAHVYEELSALYASDTSRAAKLGRRETIFLEHIAPLRAMYPELKILQTTNNAEIMQLKLYLSHLDKFEQHFQKVSSSWDAFLADMKLIRDAVSEDSSTDPFSMLKN